MASPPRSKRAVLRDVSVRLAPLPPVWRDGRVWLMALALHPTNVDLFVGARPESESTLGCRGFISTCYVHVRQIRLAPAVRKTATLRGDGGSNPLACTKLVFVASGAIERSISQPSYCEKSIVRIVCRTATSSNDRTPPCRGVRCEFDSRRSRQFSRCTLGWFGGCSFKALIRGFDSRHRRHFTRRS